MKSMSHFQTFLIITLLFVFTSSSRAADSSVTATAPLAVGTHNLRVHLSDQGEIVGMDVGPKLAAKKITAATQLPDCRTVGKVTRHEIAGGGLRFVRTLERAKDGRRFTLTETFAPAADSIRWEIEITDPGAPWSEPIQTVLRYPVGTDTRWWTAWADPRNGSLATAPRDQLVAQGIVPRVKESGNWADPLVPIKPMDATLNYGARHYTYEKPLLHIIPDYPDVFCLPMVTFMEPAEDSAVSLVLCPEDVMLDMKLTTTADGTASMNRLFHRIGDGRTLRFRMDLVSHPADPRAALGWIQRRYTDFFVPPNPRAHQIAGTGSYSNSAKFDAAKLNRMAYNVYWRASFDFPYMGMFLPPVPAGESWKCFRNEMTSVEDMNRLAAAMHKEGFHVLSYFNVTEFGTGIKFPPPGKFDVAPDKLWTDPNAFLYTKLRDAMLMVPDKQKSLLPNYKPGEPFWTWCRAVAMDCGEPVYRDFLLDQARQHIERLPQDDGFAIDRMDWLRIYNQNRDDGLSWFDDRPARSLRVSWRELMDRLGPLMHNADKVIFCNNHDKRLEILRHADGIFDEFTNSGRSLNAIALLGLSKPVMGWTNTVEELKPDADAFFQKYLYLGVFPMAPFPGNDHSIGPDKWGDQQYLDYGPLLRLMRGKRWVLRPHCVDVPAGNAKANLFRVADGYVVPVVYADDSPTVRVRLGDFARIAQTRNLKITALHPGDDKPVAVTSTWDNDTLLLDVPVKRHCAMVHVQL
ncbi:MAG TPA: hypothetical protein VJL29_12350 [Thermoguttaceae bacterium]|nr:hypothetical protein [Thermoguttaceae bacterium]